MLFSCYFPVIIFCVLVQSITYLPLFFFYPGTGLRQACSASLHPIPAGMQNILPVDFLHVPHLLIWTVCGAEPEQHTRSKRRTCYLLRQRTFNDIPLPPPRPAFPIILVDLVTTATLRECCCVPFEFRFRSTPSPWYRRGYPLTACDWRACGYPRLLRRHSLASYRTPYGSSRRLYFFWYANFERTPLPTYCLAPRCSCDNS